MRFPPSRSPIKGDPTVLRAPRPRSPPALLHLHLRSLLRRQHPRPTSPPWTKPQIHTVWPLHRRPSTSHHLHRRHRRKELPRNTPTHLHLLLPRFQQPKLNPTRILISRVTRRLPINHRRLRRPRSFSHHRLLHRRRALVEIDHHLL